MVTPCANGGPIDFDRINSGDAAKRSDFVKKLLQIAGDSPDLLYPYYNVCASLIRHENNLVKWAGIDTIGMMASVDHENKSLVQIPILIQLLKSGNIITCNHAIYALGLITSAFPEQRKQIIGELISIGKNGFETVESREVVQGKVIETLAKIYTAINDDADVLAFIRNCCKSRHDTTKKKAKELAARLGLTESANPQNS